MNIPAERPTPAAAPAPQQRQRPVFETFNYNVLVPASKGPARVVWQGDSDASTQRTGKCPVGHPVLLCTCGGPHPVRTRWQTLDAKYPQPSGLAPFGPRMSVCAPITGR